MDSSTGTRLSLVLASILLVTVLAAGTFVSVIASSSRDNTVDLAERVAPASLLLLNLDRDAYQAELFLERVVHRESSGLDAVDDRVLHAENRAQLLGERWITFREIADYCADVLPGEAEHAQMFERDRDIWLATATSVLDMAPGPEREALLEQAKVEFDTARNHLDVLEEEYWEPQIAILGAATTDDINTATYAIVVTVVVVAAVTVLLTITNIVALRRQARDHSRREEELLDNTRRQSFETVLRRGLEMAQTESAALDIVARATDQSVERVELSELLLNNSSRSHLRSTQRRGRVRGNARVWGLVTGRVSGGRDRHPSGVRRLRGAGRLPPPQCPLRPAAQRRVRPGQHQRASVRRPPPDPRRSTTSSTSGSKRRSPRSRTTPASRMSVLRNRAMAAHQASTDPLTGLANRRSLEAAVHGMRETCDQLGILMVDLDHFKALNDTHGHETGDRALRLFADAARDVTRDGETVAARWGGEEFVIVIGDAGAEDAARVAERLREALAIRLIDAATPRIHDQCRRHLRQRRPPAPRGSGARRSGALRSQAERPRPGQHRRRLTPPP